MSDIYICREHQCDMEQARRAANEVAEDISTRFEVDYHWHGDKLHFKRSGVDGWISIDPSQIVISAKLGFMLSMLKGPIEDQINAKLDTVFS